MFAVEWVGAQTLGGGMTYVGPTTTTDIWLFPSRVMTPSPTDFVLGGENASELGKNADPEGPNDVAVVSSLSFGWKGFKPNGWVQPDGWVQPFI